MSKKVMSAKLNKFLELVSKKAGTRQLSDAMYVAAVNVFFFNDLDKLPVIDERTVNYYWGAMVY